MCIYICYIVSHFIHNKVARGTRGPYISHILFCLVHFSRRVSGAVGINPTIFHAIFSIVDNVFDFQPKPPYISYH